jgi:hypothetical protein
MQKILHEVIENNADNGEIQIKAVAQLQSITNELETYFMTLPKISRVGAMDVDTLFPSSVVNNNNTTNNNSYNNDFIRRWCERCNKTHALDKNGHQKCPEMKVGLPEERIEGYYDKDEIDPQKKF